MSELEGLSREQLIEKARSYGVRRAELLTRVELRDEILRLRTPDHETQRRERGWFGVARDLLASVVDGGLNLPQAARVIRGPDDAGAPAGGAPVATVTLAEIYAGQGHVERALSLLDRILDEEPDHLQARILRERLARQGAAERRSTADRSSSLGAVFATSSASSRVNVVVSGEAVAETAPDVPAAGEAVVAAAPDVPVAGETVVATASQQPAVSEARVEIAPNTSGPSALEGDEVAVVVGAQGETFVYWEFTAGSVEALRRRYPDGQCVVRVLCTQPTWDGPLCRTLDIPATELLGFKLIERRGARSVVRASAGWRSGKRFLPLAVASELRVAAPSGTGATSAAALSWVPSWRRSTELSAAERRALESVQR